MRAGGDLWRWWADDIFLQSTDELHVVDVFSSLDSTALLLGDSHGRVTIVCHHLTVAIMLQVSECEWWSSTH